MTTQRKILILSGASVLYCLLAGTIAWLLTDTVLPFLIGMINLPIAFGVLGTALNFCFPPRFRH